MHPISDRLKRIKPSATMAITEKARRLTLAQRPIIGLSQGEPDFDTPEHICAAAIEAMKQGKTRYTTVDGISELKEAICAKFESENDVRYQPNQISVATGGKQILYNALMATVNEGDEVIISAPYWVSYPDIVLLCGGVPVFVTCGQEQGFKLTAAGLAEAITPRTRWVILNSPSNPSGAAYTEKEIRQLAEVLNQNPHVLVMADDIYEHLVYDDFRFFTPAQIGGDLTERVLTCNGMSKAYCMTGWRMGFAGGPEWLIKAMAKLQSQSTSNPTSISQYAAVAGLNGPKDFLAENLAMFRQRRDLVVNLLNQVPGLDCPTPNGAFYVYPSCAGVIDRVTPSGQRIKSDNDFVEYLLDEAEIAAVPGDAFGLSPHFRVSYATSTELLEEACERIHRAVNKLD
ncbi:MAG: pyridoxal phosphate-dependent aminotransferase [Arenicellales bacterium]|nr:pyridoxal phosphate-dependent aminotransferase [Arenicellales bacterium]